MRIYWDTETGYDNNYDNDKRYNDSNDNETNNDTNNLILYENTNADN